MAKFQFLKFEITTHQDSRLKPVIKRQHFDIHLIQFTVLGKLTVCWLYMYKIICITYTLQ